MFYNNCRNHSLLVQDHSFLTQRIRFNSTSISPFTLAHNFLCPILQGLLQCLSVVSNEKNMASPELIAIAYMDFSEYYADIKNIEALKSATPITPKQTAGRNGGRTVRIQITPFKTMWISVVVQHSC